jgi:phage gp46-like protein
VLALAFDPDRREADLVYGSGVLLSDTLDLQTAALDLLFCDARAEEGETLTDGLPRRGYWADSFDEDGAATGSLLWLLEEAEATLQTAARAEGYTQARLKTLIDDGHIRAVTTTSEVSEDNVFVAAELHLFDGTTVTIAPFKVLRD